MINFQNRTGNYAQAGNAVANDLVKSFAAARRSGPNYGKMVQDAANIRTAEKKASIQTQSQVAQTGVNAAGKLKAHNIKLEGRENLRGAKRKAGVLAAGGKLIAGAGDAFKKTPEYESTNLDYSGMITKLREEAAALYGQVGKGGTKGSTDTSPPKTDTSTDNSTSIPQYTPPKPGKTYSKSELETLAVQGGFSKDDAPLVAQIAMGESSGNPTAFNGKGADQSYGIMQINMLGGMGPERRAQFGIKSNEDLYDPLTNMKAAHQIYKQQGWGAWGAYTNGSYKNF